MSYDFVTKVPAKWILNGEHAVLRGHPALVFPMTEFHLDCQYQASLEPLQVFNHGQINEDLGRLVHKLSQRAMEFLQCTSSPPLLGKLTINANIPIGQGMGASAALCVAIARWICFLGYCSNDLIMALAHALEHYFHGQSSGLDVAGVSAQQGLWFCKGNTESLDIRWQPKLYLSNTGNPGITTDCIQAVGKLAETEPTRAAEIDAQMANASRLAKLALSNPHHSEGLQDLSQAIKIGRDCFLDWQLYSPSMHAHEDLLYSLGALAVKPTGSGKGGCFISLWRDTPSSQTSIHLYPLFDF